MSDDEPCQVCITVHSASRPADLVYTLPQKAGMEFTGPSEVLRQDHMQDEVLDRYEADLEAMVGTCLYCRIEGLRFNHIAGQCSRRFRWINAKKEAYESRKSKSQEWIRRYVACWECYQPQDICRVADPEHEESQCRFQYMVMPLCYGVYCRLGARHGSTSTSSAGSRTS